MGGSCARAGDPVRASACVRSELMQADIVRLGVAICGGVPLGVALGGSVDVPSTKGRTAVVERGGETDKVQEEWTGSLGCEGVGGEEAHVTLEDVGGIWSSEDVDVVSVHSGLVEVTLNRCLVGCLFDS